MTAAPLVRQDSPTVERVRQERPEALGRGGVGMTMRCGNGHTPCPYRHHNWVVWRFSPAEGVGKSTLGGGYLPMANLTATAIPPRSVSLKSTDTPAAPRALGILV